MSEPKDLADCTKMFQTKETCDIKHHQTEKVHEQMHESVLNRIETIEHAIRETDVKLARVHERIDDLVKETNQQTQDLVIVMNEKNQALERLVNEKNHTLEMLVLSLQDKLKNKVIAGLCIIVFSFAATLGNVIWQSALRSYDKTEWQQLQHSVNRITQQVGQLDNVEQKECSKLQEGKKNGKPKYR